MLLDDGRLSCYFIHVADRIAGDKAEPQRQRRTMSVLLRLVAAALTVRIAMLLLMALSCHVLPDFIPGDDSLAKFDLRLDVVSEQQPDLSDSSNRSRPFALDHFSFCHCFFQCTTETPSTPMTTAPVKHFTNRTTTSDQVWSILLTPLTRWDAARFLRLAHEPLLRHPRLKRRLLLLQTTTQQNGDERCPEPDYSMLLRDAEEAHAFLPLFPLAIQVTATILLWLVPKSLLPPTCEGTLAFSAWILNTACFVWSALALYHLTRAYLAPRHEGDAGVWATRVAVLYIINPANVFFGSAYSEALGSALVFTGCAFFAHFEVQQQTRLGWKSIALLLTSWWCFLLSCWVRSNGTVYAGFFLLYAFGHALSLLVERPSWGAPYSVLFIFLAMMLVLGSIICHNYNAVQRLCDAKDDTMVQNDDSLLHHNAHEYPQWCERGRWFNLYGHVQRMHWDVGPFRYYQLKQIPNFLLAGPVLSVALLAVAGWIKASWERYKSSKFAMTGLAIVDWAIKSLADFALPMPPPPLSPANDELCGGEKMLGHYAVLAASTFIVLVVAHVQIGTRLILSTSPAIYWYLAVMISRQTRTSDWILVWCLLYHGLGLVMHPNWLPWT
jgi:GPI mannosyltransferase 2